MADEEHEAGGVMTDEVEERLVGGDREFGLGWARLLEAQPDVSWDASATRAREAVRSLERIEPVHPGRTLSAISATIRKTAYIGSAFSNAVDLPEF